MTTKTTPNPHDYLDSLLSPANRESLRDHQWIYVRGSNGGKFIIFYAFSGNVREMRPEWEPGMPFLPFRSWCAYPYGISHSHLLHANAFAISMITQMLCIQTDEDRYRDVAIS